MQRITAKLRHGGNYAYEEGFASEADIRPGMLLAIGSPMATSGPGTTQRAVAKHATAGAKTGLTVATEDALQGKTADFNAAKGDTLADIQFAQNDPVSYFQYGYGDELYVLVASGQNVAVNGPVASNGDGKFKVATGADFVFGEFDEALGVLTADTLVRIRVF